MQIPPEESKQAFKGKFSSFTIQAISKMRQFAA